LIALNDLWNIKLPKRELLDISQTWAPMSQYLSMATAHGLKAKEIF